MHGLGLALAREVVVPQDRTELPLVQLHFTSHEHFPTPWNGQPSTSCLSNHALQLSGHRTVKLSQIMDDEPRKRSRFDQTEPPRKSRFDRRSRSPTTRDSESRPHRTPPPDVKSPGSEGTSNAASAAAAAAARINAQLNAKKGIQHVDVPPIRQVGATAGAFAGRWTLTCIQTQSPTAGGGDARSPSQPGGDAPLREEAYQQDGDFIKDIEVNDLRNRYTLTKGSTQKMVNTALAFCPLILPGQ